MMMSAAGAAGAAGAVAGGNNKRRETDLRKLIRAGYQVGMGAPSTTVLDFYVKFRAPKDSYYEGGIYRVHVTLPAAYPYKSPSIGFCTPILHPNVDEASGSVCLDVINQTWSPMFDLVNVFSVFLPQLLLYPNPSDPLNGLAASLMLKDKEAYKQRVVDHVRRHASADFKMADDDEDDDDDDDDNDDDDGEEGKKTNAHKASDPRPITAQRGSSSLSISSTSSTASISRTPISSTTNDSLHMSPSLSSSSPSSSSSSSSSASSAPGGLSTALRDAHRELLSVPAIDDSCDETLSDVDELPMQHEFVMDDVDAEIIVAVSSRFS